MANDLDPSLKRSRLVPIAAFAFGGFSGPAITTGNTHWIAAEIFMLGIYVAARLGEL